MRLVIFTEPQRGASYEDQRRVARAAEELAFDGFFRSDHFLAVGGPGVPGPTDAWVTLAGLALCCGRNDAEVRRRADAIGEDVEALRASGGAVGTPDELVDFLGRHGEAGATRVFLQTMDMHDLDHIEMVATDVAPQLR